jgi:hypothetical protein
MVYLMEWTQPHFYGLSELARIGHLADLAEGRVRRFKMKVTTLGIDLAKSIFRIHGVDVRGAVVLRRQLTRKQVLPFLTRLEPCLVGWKLAAALTIGPVRSASSAILRG